MEKLTILTIPKSKTYEELNEVQLYSDEELLLKKILKDEIISLTDATVDMLQYAYQPDNGAWDVKVILDRTYKDL